MATGNMEDVIAIASLLGRQQNEDIDSVFATAHKSSLRLGNVDMAGELDPRTLQRHGLQGHNGSGRVRRKGRI